jgi:hypothetical protein
VWSFSTFFFYKKQDEELKKRRLEYAKVAELQKRNKQEMMIKYFAERVAPGVNDEAAKKEVIITMGKLKWINFLK